MEHVLPTELSARVKFCHVVDRMEKIANAPEQQRKAGILQRFFNSLLELQQKFREAEGPNANASFYPFLRLFVPKLDVQRGSYGIKTRTLGRLFVKAIAVNPDSDTARKLTHLEGQTADYGDIVYDVMKNRSPEEGTLTVYEVNKYLDLIATHFKESERNKIDNEMVQMMNGMTAIERKWLTRILLKKLKLNLGEKRLMEMYNANAWKLYNEGSHLSRVCLAIETNEPLIQDGCIDIFKPIRPMLCERGYVSEINMMLSKNTYYLETKMDGERCQVHVNENQFKYFSRNCRDEITDKFGATSTTGIYSPFLHSKLNGKVKTAIFDGEIMVWDREADAFVKKASNAAAKYLNRNDPRLNPCFCAYDILYLNGKNLTNMPYSERIRVLYSIIEEQKGSLMLCSRTKVRDANHFLQCLNNAFDANEEGVVIKQDDSRYAAGQREKGGWFKMKPDYENNLISDFDLLIIGYYYNDTQTDVDSFLLGILKKDDLNDSANVFYSVCTIRNGLSRSEFKDILQKLQPFSKKVNKQRINGSLVYESPAGIEWKHSNPDYWVEPTKSIVLQIKASELVETTTYRTSHSFRFPRVMSIRYDKSWKDICSLEEFQKFCTSNSKVEKLTRRHATAHDLISGPAPKRRRQITAPMNSTCGASSSKEFKLVDDICKGREFCIINGEKNSCTVEELEAMVLKHGGKVVKNPNSNTFITISGDPKIFKVKQMIEKKLYNIATAQWLIRALGSDKSLSEIRKFTPSDMIFATPALEEQLAAECDHYNSSQHLDNEIGELSIDNEDLANILAMNNPSSALNDSNECCEIDDEATRVETEGSPTLGQNQIPDLDVYDMETEPMDFEKSNEMVMPTTHEEEKTTVTIETKTVGQLRFDDTSEENLESQGAGCFDLCTAFFYEEYSNDPDITFAQFMFIAGGGNYLKTIDDVRSSVSRLTHIFVTDRDFNLANLKQTVESFNKGNIENIQVLRYQWILDCHEKGEIICEKKYKVNVQM